MGEIRALEEIYRRPGATPDNTIEQFTREAGDITASQTVAAIIKAHPRDGRISSANKEWATAVMEDYPTHTPDVISTSIHMAHIDQLASAIRKRNRQSR